MYLPELGIQRQIPTGRCTLMQAPGRAIWGESEPVISLNGTRAYHHPLQYEDARLEWKNPGGNTRSTSTQAKATKGKRKKDDDDDGDAPPTKRTKPSSAPTKTKGPKFDVLLAQTYKSENGPDPTGWWISEKLDGVRCARILLPLRSKTLM